MAVAQIAAAAARSRPSAGPVRSRTAARRWPPADTPGTDRAAGSPCAAAPAPLAAAAGSAASPSRGRPQPPAAAVAAATWGRGSAPCRAGIPRRREGFRRRAASHLEPGSKTRGFFC